MVSVSIKATVDWACHPDSTACSRARGLFADWATISVAVLFLTLSLGHPAQAEDRGVAYAGTTIGDGLSSYAGVTRNALFSLAGQPIGGSLSGSGGTYHYADDNGSTIHGEYRSVSAGLNMELTNDHGWASLSLGPRLYYTHHRPSPSPNEDGQHITAWFGLDGSYMISQHWRIETLEQYGVGNREYQARVSLSKVVGRHDLRFGWDLATQGDRTYSNSSTGLFAARQLTRNIQLRASGGELFERSGRKTPYVALELTTSY